MTIYPHLYAMNRLVHATLCASLFVAACQSAEPVPQAFAGKAANLPAPPAAPLASGFTVLSAPQHKKAFLSLWTFSGGAFAVGEDGAIASSDAKTMTLLSAPLLTAVPERLFAFAANGKTLVAAGEKGRLLRSLDAGATWKQESLPVSASMRVILFTRKGELWVAGDSAQLFHSKDNGETWAVSWLPKPLTVNGLFETSEGGLYVASPRGTLFHSPDQENWVEYALPKTPQYFLDIWSSPDGEVIVSGGDGYISRSTNGKTWSRIKLETRADLMSIYAKSPDELYVAGFKGTILYSSNRGKSWTRRTTGTTANLTKLFATSDGTMIAVGYNGEIISSSDGVTWQRQQSPTKRALFGGFATPDGGAYAVGDRGVLLKRSAGTWEALTSSDSPTLHSVWGSSATSLYAVGADGVVRASSDGKSFTPIKDLFVGNGPVRVVWGSDASNLYLGTGAKIVHSHDAGASWKTTRLTGCAQVEDLFGDASVTFALCTNAILASTDQGATWTAQSATHSGGFVKGASTEKIFFAATNKGEVFKTSDLGASWSAVIAPTSEPIVSIWARSAEKIFVATAKQVYQSDNAGASWKTLDVGAPAAIHALRGNATHLFISGAEGMLLSKALP